MNNIFLLTGWGVGSNPLKPLASQLEQIGYQVTLVDLPYQAHCEQWLTTIAKALPKESIWLGWSLGGQILSYLTNDYSKQCLALITLASNPCFKARPDWPTAMAVDTFTQFQQAYKQASQQTMKRFLQLVAQGSPEAKTLVRTLQEEVVVHPVAEANVGLDLLATLDARESLQSFAKRQYHIFAEQDSLVPVSCANALASLLGGDKVLSLADVGHAFPVQSARQTALLIDNFVKSGDE